MRIAKVMQLPNTTAETIVLIYDEPKNLGKY